MSIRYFYPSYDPRDRIEGIFQSFEFYYRDFSDWMLQNGSPHRKEKGLESGSFAPQNLLKKVEWSLENQNLRSATYQNQNVENYKTLIQNVRNYLSNLQDTVLFVFSQMGIYTLDDLQKFWNKGISIQGNNNTKVNEILNTMEKFLRGSPEMEAIFQGNLNKLASERTIGVVDDTVEIKTDWKKGAKEENIVDDNNSSVLISVDQPAFLKYIEEKIGELNNETSKKVGIYNETKGVTYVLELGKGKDGKLTGKWKRKAVKEIISEIFGIEDTNLRLNVNKIPKNKLLEEQVVTLLEELRDRAIRVIYKEGLTDKEKNDLTSEGGILDKIIKDTAKNYSKLYIQKATDRQNDKNDTDQKIVHLTNYRGSTSLMTTSKGVRGTKQQGELGELGDVLVTTCLSYNLSISQNNSNNKNGENKNSQRYELEIYKTGHAFSEVGQQLIGQDLIIVIKEGESTLCKFGIQTKNPFERNVKGNKGGSEFAENGPFKSDSIKKYYRTYTNTYKFTDKSSTTSAKENGAKNLLFSGNDFNEGATNLFRSYLSLNETQYQNLCQTVLNANAVQNVDDILLKGLQEYALEFMRMNQQSLSTDQINQAYTTEIEELKETQNLFYTVDTNLISSVDILDYLLNAIEELENETNGRKSGQLGVVNIDLTLPTYRGKGARQPITGNNAINLLSTAKVKTEMNIPII